MLPDKSGIYRIKHIKSNKDYIGSAVNLRTRWNNHIGVLRNNKHHNSYLQNAFNKYGEDSFRFEIIEFVEDKTKLIEREQYWIDYYKVCDEKYGYNMSPIAGSTLGKPCKEETKRHISEAKTGRPNGNKGKKKPGFVPPKPFPKGIIPWNKGQDMSEEYKEQCRKREEGFKLSGKSDQIKEKISKALKGKPNWRKGTRKFIAKDCPVCGVSFSRCVGYVPTKCCSLKCGYIYRSKMAKEKSDFKVKDKRC